MTESERDRGDVEKQAPIPVGNRDEFEDALPGLFDGGPPLEAPSAEALEQWGVDLEDEGGGIEER